MTTYDQAESIMRIRLESHRRASKGEREVMARRNFKATTDDLRRLYGHKPLLKRLMRSFFK